jgi:hypothetical protein
LVRGTGAGKSLLLGGLSLLLGERGSADPLAGGGETDTSGDPPSTQFNLSNSLRWPPWEKPSKTFPESTFYSRLVGTIANERMCGMCEVALALSILFSGDKIKLDEYVIEFPSRRMAIPVFYNAGRIQEIECILLYISEDRGKTWKLVTSCKPTEKEIFFEAEHDGVYWFAIRVTMKDGHSEPPKSTALEPAQKIKVNTKTVAALKPKPSYEQLEKENEELKDQLTRLNKRIRSLQNIAIMVIWLQKELEWVRKKLP